MSGGSGAYQGTAGSARLTLAELDNGPQLRSAKPEHEQILANAIQEIASLHRRLAAYQRAIKDCPTCRSRLLAESGSSAPPIHEPVDADFSVLASGLPENPAPTNIRLDADRASIYGRTAIEYNPLLGGAYKKNRTAEKQTTKPETGSHRPTPMALEALIAEHRSITPTRVDLRDAHLALATSLESAARGAVDRGHAIPFAHDPNRFLLGQHDSELTVVKASPPPLPRDSLAPQAPSSLAELAGSHRQMRHLAPFLKCLEGELNGQTIYEPVGASGRFGNGHSGASSTKPAAADAIAAYRAAPPPVDLAGSAIGRSTPHDRLNSTHGGLRISSKLRDRLDNLDRALSSLPATEPLAT